MSVNSIRWIALRYTVPAEPSRSRVYVWRHLRALRAQAVGPGFAVLPDTQENVRALTALADDVRRLGGEALLVRFDFLREEDEREIRRRFEEAAREEEQTLLRRCEELAKSLSGQEGGRRAAAVRELRETLDRLEKSPLRPFFRKSTVEELSHAAGEIFGTLRGLPGEVSALLHFSK